jgi:hypothetical protein
MNVLLLLLTAKLHAFFPFFSFLLPCWTIMIHLGLPSFFLLAHQNPTNNFFPVPDEKKKKNFVSTGWR